MNRFCFCRKAGTELKCSFTLIANLRNFYHYSKSMMENMLVHFVSIRFKMVHDSFKKDIFDKFVT